MHEQTDLEGIDRLFAWLPAKPDLIVLELAEPDANADRRCALHVRRGEYPPAMSNDIGAHVCADPCRMPFAAETFDAAILHENVQFAGDLDLVIAQVGHVLKSGGLMIAEARLVPDDARAAGYVQAFERLCDPRQRQLYAEFQWRGMCMNAGMIIEQIEVVRQRTRLTEWAQRFGCDAGVIARLHILLAQAPRAVRMFWNPSCAGTQEAAFDQHHLLLIGRKL